MTANSETRHARNTWAIILAGSHVWRDDGLDTVCPRVLLPIANTPLICHTLAWLRAAGIQRATICTNYAANLIAGCLHDGSVAGLDLYYYEDRLPRGPAGCIADAAATTDESQFLVVEGAIIPDLDLAALLDVHACTRAVATVVVRIASGDDAGAEPRMTPVGIYVLARAALESVGRTGFQDIKETLIPQLHRAGSLVSTYPVAWTFPRLLGLDSYLSTQTWALERLYSRQRSCEGYAWQAGAYQHETARLAPRVRIIEPVMIGPDTYVDSHAVLIGPCVIGGDVQVGRGAVVGRAVLWDACRIGPQVVVDQAVVATGVAVDAGVLRGCLALPVPGLPPRSIDGRNRPQRPAPGLVSAAKQR